MAGGRPLKYNNCLDLDIDCELYFESCLYEDDDDYGSYQKRDKPIPLTITGLALALGTSRQTLMNYENRGEFFDTIKRHKTRIENFAELRLYENNATGPIFALKNFGWKDKSEQDLKVSGPVRIKVRHIPEEVTD